MLYLGGKAPSFAKEASPEEEPRLKQMGSACGALRRAMNRKGVVPTMVKPLWQEGKILASIEGGEGVHVIAAFDGTRVQFDCNALLKINLTLDEVNEAAVR